MGLAEALLSLHKLAQGEAIEDLESIAAAFACVDAYDSDETERIIVPWQFVLCWWKLVAMGHLRSDRFSEVIAFMSPSNSLIQRMMGAGLAQEKLDGKVLGMVEAHITKAPGGPKPKG